MLVSVTNGSVSLYIHNHSFNWLINEISIYHHIFVAIFLFYFKNRNVINCFFKFRACSFRGSIPKYQLQLTSTYFTLLSTPIYPQKEQALSMYISGFLFNRLFLLFRDLVYQFDLALGLKVKVYCTPRKSYGLSHAFGGNILSRATQDISFSTE